MNVDLDRLAVAVALSHGEMVELEPGVNPIVATAIGQVLHIAPELIAVARAAREAVTFHSLRDDTCSDYSGCSIAALKLAVRTLDAVPDAEPAS